MQHVPNVMMDLGPLGIRAAQMARAHELGVAYVDLHRIKIDDSVRSLVPLTTLLEHQVLPLKCSDDCLWLACSDPANFAAFQTIRSLTGLNAIPVLALAREIEDVLQKRSGSNDV
jgi:type IV pilus assembly protein PilB